MKIKNNIRKFRQSFIQPRVIIFIIIGTSIIFLTFLTNDNALEIAISGLASVFIGIGVNNFTSFEIHEKDKQKINTKTGHILKLMEIMKTKMVSMSKDLPDQNRQKIIDGFAELEQCINLSEALLNDERKLD